MEDLVQPRVCDVAFLTLSIAVRKLSVKKASGLCGKCSVSSSSIHDLSAGFLDPIVLSAA